MKRSPLKPKRTRPRRAEGRVTHARMKPRAKAAPTAEERKHLDRVAGLGCLICGSPASIHHLMTAPGKERRRDHRYVVPLCREHHQGDTGVHGLGSEAAFEALWGVDLVWWGTTAWLYRDAPYAPFWRDGVTRMRALAEPVLLKHKGGRGVTQGSPKDEQPAAARRSTRPSPTA